MLKVFRFPEFIGRNTTFGTPPNLKLIMRESGGLVKEVLTKNS